MLILGQPPNEIFGDTAGDVKVDTCLVLVDKNQDKSNLDTSVLVYEGFIRSEILSPETATQAFVVKQNNWMGQEETTFTLIHPKESTLLQKLEAVSSPLEEYCEFCLGITPYDKYRGHTSEQIKNKVFHANLRLDDTYKKLLVSGDVGRYIVAWNGEEWIKYGHWLGAQREQRFFTEERILFQQIIDWSSLRILVGWTDEELYNTQNQFNLLAKPGTNLKYILAILSSTTITHYHRRIFLDVSLQRFQKVLIKDAKRFPIRRISFTTSATDRERLTREAIGAYDIGDNASVLQRMQLHIDADKTDVVHDLLAHLAQQMIDLNKQKQAEVRRFLTWVEERLKIHPDKNGAGGIESLTGKTILQGYLGDYQKGEGELSWREFHYRLYQNRNRFAVSLSDVEGEIQREYETSLETLLPIKCDLTRTDALIDKIVYRLYALTDDEIELIERPQYEQALADAKAQVVADEEIKDDEEKIEKIAAGILPAAKRFFERVEPASVEATLDSELPNWRSLPPDAPTFLLTGDYNLHTLPEHMDFSSSVIPYTKAVETVLYERIFAPFRDGSGYAEADCNNEFLKDFMRGKKKLTLGNFMIILRSSRETALQTFISRTYPDAAQRVFGAKGLVATLNDVGMLDIRNKAAHDEVLSHDEAQQTRAWAMQILGQV